MMKRTLLLLSLLAVPCVVISCMDDAAPGTGTAAPGTTTATESPLDKMCNLLKLAGYSEKEIKILRAGYEGDTVTLESLKDKEHIGIYCTGAAAAGNKELVLQCLDKGAKPNLGLRDAAAVLAVPCVVTSCKEDAAPGSATAAPGTTTATESTLDKICNLKKLSGYSEKQTKIFRAGYTGDTATLDKLNGGFLLNNYCDGAAAAGNKELVLKCLDKGSSPNVGLSGAAEGGHMDIVQLMLDKGATDYDEGLEGAAWGGHMGIVQLLLSKGADLNQGLRGAALGGHMDIVQLLLSKGADLNQGLRGAALGGHMDIVQLLLSKGADPDEGLYWAAEGGHMDIVQLLLSKGATDYNQGLSGAAWGGWPYGHCEVDALQRRY